MTIKSILPTSCMVAAAFLVMTLSVACVTRPIPGSLPDSGVANDDFEVYRKIKAEIDRDGATIDYDTLFGVYWSMVQSPRPVAHTDCLLWQLIRQRNEDPRIDQMVLILAARIMGSSRHAISGAQKLFGAILKQDDRINYWVLSHVAESVGDYAYDMPEGDRLADEIEAELSRLVAQHQSDREDFGRHFLPPPKNEIILNYINSISVKADRQSERSHYYYLIRAQFSEEQIVKAFKYLQAHGMPDKDERCPLLLKCVLRYIDRLPIQ